MGVNSLPWYYAPAIGQPGEIVILAGEEWHHCFHVLRMSPGDAIILFDRKGNCMEGLIRSVSRHEGIIELTRDCRSDFQDGRTFRLAIAFAPTKNIDRTEFAVEKLVEIGVDEIIFLDCEHSERAHLRLDRMEKIILSAAKQSRKMKLPAVRDMISPVDLVAHFRRGHPETQVFICHMATGSKPLIENYSGGNDVLLLIGPEGGFSGEEAAQMIKQGAVLVTLGSHRLRVETAAILACATTHILNDLNKKP